MSNQVVTNLPKITKAELRLSSDSSHSKQSDFQTVLSSVMIKYVNHLSEISDYAAASIGSWELYFKELAKSPGDRQRASEKSNQFLFSRVEEIKENLKQRKLDSVLGQDRDLANKSDLALFSLSAGMLPETISSPIVIAMNLSGIELTRLALNASGIRKNLSFQDIIEQEDKDPLLRAFRAGRNLAMLASLSLVGGSFLGGLKLTAGISGLGVVGERLIKVGKDQEVAGTKEQYNLYNFVAEIITGQVPEEILGAMVSSKAFCILSSLALGRKIAGVYDNFDTSNDLIQATSRYEEVGYGKINPETAIRAIGQSCLVFAALIDMFDLGTGPSKKKLEELYCYGEKAEEFFAANSQAEIPAPITNGRREKINIFLEDEQIELRSSKDGSFLYAKDFSDLRKMFRATRREELVAEGYSSDKTEEILENESKDIYAYYDRTLGAVIAPTMSADLNTRERIVAASFLVHERVHSKQIGDRIGIAHFAQAIFLKERGFQCVFGADGTFNIIDLEGLIEPAKIALPELAQIQAYTKAKSYKTLTESKRLAAANTAQVVMPTHLLLLRREISEIDKSLIATLPSQKVEEFYRTLLLISADDILGAVNNRRVANGSPFPLLVDAVVTENFFGIEQRGKLLETIVSPTATTFNPANFAIIQEAPWLSAAVCLLVSLGIKPEVAKNSSLDSILGSAILEVLATNSQDYDRPGLSDKINKHDWTKLIRSPKDLNLFLHMLATLGGKYAEQVIYFLREDESSLYHEFKIIYQASKTHLGAILSDNQKYFLPLLSNVVSNMTAVPATHQGWLGRTISDFKGLILDRYWQDASKIRSQEQQEEFLQQLVNVWLRPSFPSKSPAGLKNMKVVNLVLEQLKTLSADPLKIQGIFFCSALNVLIDLGYKEEVLEIFQNSEFAKLLNTSLKNARSDLNKYVSRSVLIIRGRGVNGLYLSENLWEKVQEWDTAAYLEYVVNETFDTATARSTLPLLISEIDYHNQMLSMNWMTDPTTYDQSRRELLQFCSIFFKLNSRLVGNQDSFDQRMRAAKEIKLNLEEFLIKAGVYDDGKLKLGGYNQIILGKNGHLMPEFLKMIALYVVFTWLVTRDLNEKPRTDFSELEVQLDDLLSQSGVTPEIRQRVYQSVLNVVIFSLYQKEIPLILKGLIDDKIFTPKKEKKAGTAAVMSASSTETTKKVELELDPLGLLVTEYCESAFADLGLSYVKSFLLGLGELQAANQKPGTPNYLPGIISNGADALNKLLGKDVYLGLRALSTKFIGDIAAPLTPIFTGNKILAAAIPLLNGNSSIIRMNYSFDQEFTVLLDLHFKGAQLYEIMAALANFDYKTCFPEMKITETLAKRWGVLLHFLILIGGKKDVGEIVNNACPSYMSGLSGRIENLNHSALKESPLDYFKMLYYLLQNEPKFSLPITIMHYQIRDFATINTKFLLGNDLDHKINSESLFYLGLCWSLSQRDKLKTLAIDKKKEAVMKVYLQFVNDVYFNQREKDLASVTSKANLLAGMLAGLIELGDVDTANFIFRESLEFGESILSGINDRAILPAESSAVYLAFTRAFYERGQNIKGIIAGVNSIQDIVLRIIIGNSNFENENHKIPEYVKLCLSKPQDRANVVEAAQTLFIFAQRILFNLADSKKRDRTINPAVEFLSLAVETLAYLEEHIEKMSDGKQKYQGIHERLRDLIIDVSSEALVQRGLLRGSDNFLKWSIIVDLKDQKIQMYKILSYYLLYAKDNLFERCLKDAAMPRLGFLANILLEIYLFGINKAKAVEIMKNMLEIPVLAEIINKPR